MFGGLTLVNTAGWCISKLLREQKRHSGKRDSPANGGDIRDVGSTPVSRRSPGGGHSNPLLYSWLENSMDREAWQASVHGVTKSWTRLSD